MESTAREEGPSPDGGGGCGTLAGDPSAAAGGGDGGERPPAPADRRCHRQVIRWERFLPRRSLRVLLVEHDDSTRHIVAALLRKCSYHVAAVADGLKAWEVLKEKHYNFDLVLTEVVTPSLSGVGLLSKIMGAEECKNIPVIMMSSQDSIGVVLKCMLKGAVDFLVKPVRKNELRNLWQHVWRRHCSSSYGSDNNAASDHISANAGDGSKTGENSEGSNDAQSSGSKPELETECAEELGDTILAEGGSSLKDVKAKLEHPNIGTSTVADVPKMDDDKSAGTAVGGNWSIRDPSLDEKSQQNCFYSTSLRMDEGRAFVRFEEGDSADPKLHCQYNAPTEPLKDMIDLAEPVADRRCVLAVSEKDACGEHAICEASASSHVRNKCDIGSSLLLEIPLRRPQLNGCENQDLKAKHILRHSIASAFSRYGDKRVHPSCQRPVSSALHIGAGESVNKSQLNGSNRGSDNEKNTSFSPKEMSSSHQGSTIGATIRFQVSSEGNKEDADITASISAREDVQAGPSQNAVFHLPQIGFIPLPIPVGAIPYQSLCAGYNAFLQPMFYHEPPFQPHSSATIEKAMVQIASDQSDCRGNYFTTHPPHIEYYQREANNQPSHWTPQNDEQAGDVRDLSYNPAEQANQSVSCSQDVLKGSGGKGIGETTDAAVNTGTALESGNESGVQNCDRKGLDCGRSRREAALIKFRLKRKDRCFEKKVRYYSRKKLAEQRPRVKGQFVRQKFPESMTSTEAED